MQLLIPPFRLPINTKGVLLGMEGRKEGRLERWREADFYCIINSWATD